MPRSTARAAIPARSSRSSCSASATARRSWRRSDARQFADALAAGSAYARESLSEPREGTILTVLTDFAAEAAAAGAGGAPDFRALFRQALAAARTSLDATPMKLEMLRRANVVDAGALGFVELVAGMSDYFETGIVPDDDAAIQLLRDDEVTAGSQMDLEHRYCTECMITGEAIDRRKLREEASTLGSSLVVAGSQSKVRVHIHMNEPPRVFALAARFGAVTGEKADDMQRQQEMAHHATRRHVAVVTDSAADLPESVLEALDIHVVPVRVHFGTQSYLDKVGLSSAEFFRDARDRTRSTRRRRSRRPGISGARSSSSDRITRRSSTSA